MASPKKYLVLAKVETTQFTDATPTAALNAILAKDLKVTPLKVQSEARNLMRPYFGNSEQIPVVEEAAVEVGLGDGLPVTGDEVEEIVAGVPIAAGRDPCRDVVGERAGE